MATRQSPFHSGNVSQAVGKYENPIYATVATGNVELTPLTTNSHYWTYNNLGTSYTLRATILSTGDVEFWSYPGVGVEVKGLTINATQITGWTPQELISYLQVHGIIYSLNVTNATTTTSGAIQTLGGIGIVQDAWIGGSININSLPIVYTSGAPYQLESYKAGGGILLRVGGATHSTLISHSGDSLHSGTNCNHDYIISNVLPTLATYTGHHNVLIGENSGSATITTGIYNTSVGTDALGIVTTGNFHTALGAWALGAQTAGQNCTGIGYCAGLCSELDNDVTAVGAWALSYTCGARNTAVGSYAIYGTAEIGADNTGVGYECGSRVGALTTVDSCWFGSGAGAFYSDSRRNTSIGFQTGPTVLGVGTERLELGWKALGADYGAQLCQVLASPGVNATAKFRTQIFSNETWTADGTVRMTYIDASGNIAKANNATYGVTYNPANGAFTVNGVATANGETLPVQAVNPGGATTLWSAAAGLFYGSTFLTNYAPSTLVPTGFSSTNRTASTLTVTDGGSPAFNITPTGASFSYYWHGTLYTKSAVDSIPFVGTEGMHYFYYNGATLTHTTVFDVTFMQNTGVAMVYWDATASANKFLGDERHEFMPWENHYMEHYAEGTCWMAGGTLGDFTIGSGALDTHAEFSVSDCQILDEDISHMTGTKAIPAQLPVWYRSGATAWRRIAATNAPITTTGTGRMAYNRLLAGSWSLAEITNGRWALCHVFATNYKSATPGVSPAPPGPTDSVIAIVGIAEYTSVTNARTGANNEINTLQVNALPASEWSPLGTVIYQTDNGYANTWKSRIVLTDLGLNYVDWRQKKISPSSSPTSHHNLSDLTTFDDHSQYMLDPLVAPVDNAVARWDGITGRYIQSSGITESDTGAFTWPQLTVDGTFKSAMVWYPDSTVNGTEYAITWLNESTRHTGFAIKYIGTNLETIVRAYGDVLLICDAVNAFTTKKVKFMHNGPDELCSELFSVAESGSLQLGGAGALINEFSIDGTMAGNSDTALPTEQAVVTYVAKASGTVSVTFTGPWAADRTVTCRYRKVGDLVSWSIPQCYDIANNSTHTMDSSIAVIPVALRPATTTCVPITTISINGALASMCLVKSTGFFEIRDQAQAFPAGYPSGVYYDSTISWNLS
jgi:hypothetical protein